MNIRKRQYKLTSKDSWLKRYKELSDIKDYSNYKVSLRELLRDRCKANLAFFCHFFCDPGFYDPIFHDQLCNMLQSDKAVDKLVVMARGHLKTTMAAERYPLWMAVNNPNIRCLVVSNSEPNAQKTVRSIRGMVESDKFNWLFPELVPDYNNTRWSDSSACLRRTGAYPEGTFEAAGIGTNIIRRHYDLIIEDDTVFVRKDAMTSDEMMPTREDIEKALGFHQLTIPLLIHPKNSLRVFIGTRWAEFDAIANILSKECNHEYGRFYDVLNLPTRDPETFKPLYARFDDDTIRAIETSMSKYMFHMLYLNTPLSAKEQYFKYNNMSWYEEHEVPQDGFVKVTIDPADAPTGSNRQHYTGIVACLHCSTGLYVRGYEFGRFTDAELIRKALDLADRLEATQVGVEVDRYKHLLPGFKLEMQKRGKYYSLRELNTRGRSKSERIRRLNPLHENGVVFLKKNMQVLETQLLQYPNGKFLDLIDALAWQVLDDYRAPWEKKVHKIRDISGQPTFTFEQIMRGAVVERGLRGLFDQQYQVN